MKDILEIIIIGAGGLGKEILSTLLACNKIEHQYEILGFVDDNKKLSKNFNNYTILGDIDWLLSSNYSSVGCIVATGDPKIRKKIINRLDNKKFFFPKIIHPSVIISEFTKISEGTVIQAGSIISSNIEIGEHTLINVNVTIGHDCKIGNFVTIGPGCNISGENIIENDVFFGNGVNTKDKLSVGESSFIGAGSIIGKNIPKKSIHFAPSGVLKSF